MTIYTSNTCAEREKVLRKKQSLPSFRNGHTTRRVIGKTQSQKQDQSNGGTKTSMSRPRRERAESADTGTNQHERESVEEREARLQQVRTELSGVKGWLS